MAERARRYHESGPTRLKAIWRRRRNVAAPAFALPFALVAGLAAFLPGLYESRALVLIEPSLVAGVGEDETEAKVQRLTQENLSRERLAGLARRLALHPDLDGLGADALATATRRDVDVDTQRVEQAGGKVSIAIGVRARGHDAARVAELVNDLARFYVEADRARVNSQTGALVAQLDRLRERLHAEESRVSDYQQRHLRELPQQVDIHIASLDGLNAQLEMIRMDYVRASERRRALAKQMAAPPPDPSGDVLPVPGTTAAELERLRQALRELRASKTSEHPDVLRVQRELEALEREPAKVAPRPDLSKDVAELDAQLRTLMGEERRLQRQMGGVRQSALNAPRREQELAALLPSYLSTRSAYESLLARREQLRILYGEDGERSPFRVVEEAVPARAPTVPDRARLVAMGFLFALLVAASAVWLAEQVDGALHSPGELKAFARVPLLATIPRLVTAADLRRARVRDGLRAAALVLALGAVVLAAYYLAHGNEELLRMVARKEAP